MEKGTFEYFQSGYERLNKLLNTYHKAMAESESLAAEEKHYKDFRTQMYDRYLSKYGAVQGGESKRYTEEELRQIRMELADTSFTTLLKRFFGIGKSTKESYFELVGKLNGLIRYLHEQAEMNIAKSEEAKEQFISTAKTYEAEYKKVKEETGSLPNSDWDNYQYAETSDGALLLGDVRQAFHKEVLTDFAVFQQAYKDNQLCLPYSWSVEKPLQMVCNYRKMSARQANQAVHSLILQMLRMSTEYYMEFHMMDGAMSGENFGELRNLQKARQQDIVYMNRRVTGGDFHLAKLSLDGSSISQDLAMLDRWMTVVAEELGEFKSLTEYNHAKGGEAWIPYQTVIIDNFPAGFESKDIDILNRMLTNGKTLGVFVILLNNVERWEEMNEKSTFSQESSIDTVLSKDALTAALTVDYTGEIPNIRLASSMFPCSLQLMRDDYSDYVKSIIKIVNQEKKLDNSFENLFDIEEPFGKLSTEVEKTAEDRGLHIPFAVTGRGEIMEYCLGEALNAHGLICGGTGSGKSTLLHMLISSIVMNYSPEDVEVWLADYKITEFTTYKINTPPHIRFIGLSKTPDFSYAFIDKITDEMTRRQNIIAEASHKYNQEGGKGSITNFKDYRKKNGIYSMRRLIVIIDEFHVMSQHAQAEPDYKLKLENILAEARAMGIIMLFSDQAIVDGLRGLSDKGKKQIRARIALSNYMDELKETLGESDREKLRPLVRMDVGEVAVQTVKENEDKEDVATIERAKAIYINDGWRYRVCEKARKTYHAEDYVPDGFEDGEEKPMNLDEIQVWEDNMPPQHRDGSRDMQIYLGKPVNLGFTLQFPLLRRGGNNIMSVSGTEKQQMRIIQAVLNSFQRQENYEILMLCDPYAGVYREYEPELRAYEKRDSSVQIYDNISDVCYQVNRLLAVTNHRDNERKYLVVWLGLDAMADVFSGAPICKPAELADLANEKKAGKSKKGAAEPEPEEPALSAGMIEAMSAVDDGFASLFGADALAEIKKENETAAAQPEEEPDNINEDDWEDEEEPDRYLYNAREDIARIIHIGPSRNVYHMVVYDTAASLRDFREVKTGEFKHKIAFAMSDSEAGDYLDRANLIRELPEEMAYYHNGRAGKKFVPYSL